MKVSITRRLLPVVAAGALLCGGAAIVPAVAAAAPGGPVTPMLAENTSGGGGEGWAGGSGVQGPNNTSTEPDAGGPWAPSPTVYYANCGDVLARHGGPLYAGQPGYDPRLDPNHTGVDCG